MKTYQFAIFAVIGAAIAAALVWKHTQSKCGCGGHMDDAVVIADAATE